MDESTATPPPPAGNPSNPIPHRLLNDAHQALDTFASAASQAAETLAEKTERLRLARQRLLTGCGCYARENLVISLGAAMLAGFLLRHLIRPR